MREGQIINVLLIFALTGLTSTIVLLRRIPVSGYELSPYPEGMFIFLSITTIALTIIVLINPKSNAVWLFAGIPLLIVLIPLFRGYFYVGRGDSMYHLGVVKDLLTGGTIDAVGFYPALHYYAAILSLLTDTSAEYSIVLITAVPFILWLITLPLLTRSIIGGKLYIGIIAASALLPITPISTFPRPHPATAAIFLTPLVLLPVFLTQISQKQRVLTFCPLFLILLFFHPLIALAIIGSAIFWSDWNPINSPSKLQPSLLLASILIVVIWLINFSQFESSLSSAIIGLLFEQSAGSGSTSRVGSLEMVGESIFAYTARVGGKYIFFGVFSLIAISYAIYKKNKPILLITIGSLPILAGIMIFLGAGSVNLWTRLFGVLMMFGTILAVAGIVYLGDSIDKRSPGLGKNVAVLLLVIAVVLALPTIQASPYSTQPNIQVTESSYSGYETGFKYADTSTPWYEIRTSVYRYHYAIYGAEAPPQIEFPSGRLASASIPDNFNDQSLDKMGQLYLTVTETDYEADVNLYSGFRYNESDFNYLNTDGCINRLVDTGGFTLFKSC